jgi:hypothetical protein
VPVRCLQVLVVAAVVVALRPSFAGAGSVVTTAGKTVDGLVTAAEGGVSVKAADGRVVTVPLGEIASAAFDPAKAPGPAVAPLTDRVADWAKADVGGAAGEGAGRVAVNDQGLVELTDFAKGFRVRKKGGDHCLFVHQTVRGDVTIVARLRVMEQGHAARAGLMIRGGLAADAPFAMVARTADGATCLIRRAADGAETDEVARGERRIVGATWVRLQRRGFALTAGDSLDGKTWETIGTVDLAADEAALLGLATASCNSAGGRTLFDHVSVTADGGDDAAGGLPRGIVTRGGSVLACEVVRVDDKAIDIAPTPRLASASIAASAVARCAFVPLPPATAARLDALPATGAMTVNGDFLEGEVAGVDRGQVRVTSVLLGVKSLGVRSQSPAVVLRPVAPAAATFEVRLVDRSVLRAKSLTLTKDKATIEDADLGTVTASPGELLALRKL